MKISQHIAKMQSILEELGDIDVVCLGGRFGPEWTAMDESHIEVEREIAPQGAELPCVRIGG